MPCELIFQSFFSHLFWLNILAVREKCVTRYKGSFWDADANRKWAIFTFNLPSHNHIHIAKYLFSIRDKT